MYPIPPYLADFMIFATLRFSTTLRAKKSLKQVKLRTAIIKTFHDAYEKANNEHDDDIFIWLKTYIMNQLKMQHHEFFCDRVYKYLYLYSVQGLSEHLSNKLGIDVTKYFHHTLSELFHTIQVLT